jgi:hypothetical protein
MSQRGLLFATLTTLLVVVAIFGAGEIVARVLGVKPYAMSGGVVPWSTPHLALGWTNRAGGYLADEPGKVRMNFWSDGRRASRREVESAAPRSALIVGGSWTQGFGVADEETFAWRAGEMLPSFRFDNYASGGYGTLQSLISVELLGVADGVRPDWIVYGFASFHGERNVQTYAWASGLRDRSGQRFAPPRARLDGDRIERFPPSLMRDWPLERASALVRALHDTWYRLKMRGRDEQVVPVTQRLLWQMHVAAERLDSKLLVMLIFGFKELEPYARSMARQGIALVDCRYPEDPFQPHLRVGGSGHPNAQVHEHWATCLTDWLRLNGDSPETTQSDAPPESTQASPRR